MKLLSIVSAAGLAASVAATTGKGGVVYTTVTIPVYTTYCPEPTTFTHKNHTYTVTSATTYTVCETSTFTKPPKPTKNYNSTTKPSPHPTTKLPPPHTNTTKIPTMPPTSSKTTMGPTNTPVAPSATTSKPTTVPTAAAERIAAGAGSVLALGVAIAAFVI